MLEKDSFDYYIGFATDSSDRYKASSGGVGTALTRYLLSQPDYGTSLTFVFDEHLCMYVPKLIYSESEINVCGSVYQDIDLVRYVKDHVDEIKNGIVLSCSPCQVSAIKTILDRKKIKNFIISYCCSGQTTVEGTWCYYRLLGISKKDVANMQYRGNGWPSGIQIWLKDGSVIQKDNWTEPWVSIHRSGLFKPKRCLFCKFDLGYRADLTLADPWLERYIVNEKKGATLCILTSENGKKVFRDVLAMNKIDAIPSSYDEYAVAEEPNVHKELNLQAEKKYRKRMSRLVDSKLYRKMAARNRVSIAFHIRVLRTLKFFSQEISYMQMLCKIVEKIKRRIRVRSYKKKLGGYDTNFSIGGGGA